MPDDKRIWELLMKVDTKVDRIAESQQTYATKKEHNDLNLAFTSFSSKVKSVGLIGAVIATIKAVWVYIA